MQINGGTENRTQTKCLQSIQAPFTSYPRRLFMKIKCDYCDIGFDRNPSEVNRSERLGRKQFCTRSCASKAKRLAETVHHEPNVVCAYCSKPFYKRPSNFCNSKHEIYFCCREHKDLGQRIENGIVEIHPPHYGSNNSINYRKIAFEHHPSICADCGWNKVPEILEVHHLDHNRLNNNPQNLLPLCPTCHNIRHFESKRGRWGKK